MPTDNAPTSTIRMLVPFGSGELGGSQIMTLRLLEALDRRRFDPEVWLFRDGPFRDRLKRAGIPVTVLSPWWLRLPWRLKRLQRRIADGGFDMIYLHASRLIAQLALTLEIPCVEMINMPRDPEAGGWCQFPGIDRLATRWNTAVVTPSQFIENQLVERGVPANAIHVIHSWVDAERFYRPGRREAVRADRHIDNDTPLILNVGRLSPEKAHDDLLPVAARVAAEHPKALFVIVGRGPMEDEIRRRIRRMNLKDNVRLLGFVEDMPDLYAAADLMLHTARREAFATVILEGMAAGLPIVATNVGGTPEQIDDGRTGLLAEPGDTHAMARAICNLLADEDRRHELGRQAHLKAINDFRPEPAVAAYARLFEEVVEGH